MGGNVGQELYWHHRGEPAPDEAEKSERSDARGANTMVAATIVIVLTIAAVVLVL